MASGNIGDISKCNLELAIFSMAFTAVKRVISLPKRSNKIDNTSESWVCDSSDPKVARMRPMQVIALSFTS